MYFLCILKKNGFQSFLKESLLNCDFFTLASCNKLSRPVRHSRPSCSLLRRNDLNVETNNNIDLSTPPSLPFVSKTFWLRIWNEAGSHREIIHFELLTPLFWPELYAPKESPPTFLCLAAPIGRPGGLSATEGRGGGGGPPCQGEFYKFCSPSPNNSGGGSHLPADFLKQKLLDRGHLRKGKGTNVQTYKVFKTPKLSPLKKANSKILYPFKMHRTQTVVRSDDPI